MRMSPHARRLSVKPEHRPTQVSGNRIRIGSFVYGIAGEIDDKTGAVWTLLSAMDGTRTDDELVAAVLTAHPQEKPDVVRAAVDVFAQSGHVEDVSLADPVDLTERDCERYERGMRFYRWVDMHALDGRWAPQRRLAAARVIVVGIGGTGGNAALALVASGVGQVHCIDRDVVELSNLNRQILFTEADIGRPKVEVAVERLRRLNSDIQITGQSMSITGVDDLRPLVADCDVLLLCADQPGEIRAWANRACLDAGRPWVDAGYHGPVASAAAYIPGEGACYECTWLTEHERHVARGVERDYSVVRGGSNAVAAPTAGISGHLAAHLVTALLTRTIKVQSGRLQGINIVSPEQHYVLDTQQRADCPACGDRA
jgi:molybdopterin/thiamine biosynthesis adenylyltransferase